MTGAGDTVVAVLALALAAALSAFDGARLANLAAGLAVRHLGNVAVSAEMLLSGVGRFRGQ